MPKFGQRLEPRRPVWADEAVRLRERGLSYSQIQRIINSKFDVKLYNHTSITYWTKPGWRDRVLESRRNFRVRNQLTFDFHNQSPEPAE